MSAFVRTNTILDRILARKVDDVAAAKRALPPAEVARHAEGATHTPQDVAAALRAGPNVALLAEVKHASPSKGVLIEHFDPVALASSYAAHGASAISVLTDAPFFQGHLDHLRQVRAAVAVPLLRKDFVIDAYQVDEARAAGADAVLLIVAALADAPLRDLHAHIVARGMTPLVEVHSEAELDRALAAGATLVGVNNRDLVTFTVDTSITTQLARLAPPHITLVAESGLASAADVRRMGASGAHAVLIGEALVTSPDLPAAVRALAGVPRRELLA